MTVQEILKKVKTHKRVGWGSMAVREAIAVKDQIVPILLGYVDTYLERIQQENPGDVTDAFFQSYNGYHLLGEMKETRLYPVLLKSLALPQEQLDLLFGVDLTGDLIDYLVATYDGSLEETEAVAANPRIYDFARGSLVQAMGRLCQKGRIPREEMIRFLRGALEQEKQHYDDGYILGVLETMEMLHIHELCLDAREVMLAGTLDEDEYGTFLDGIFQYDDAPREEWIGTDPQGNSAQDGPTDQEKRILNWITGRNEPCPCGSGKKFKKCCQPKQNDLRIKYPNYRVESMFQQLFDAPPIIYPPIENVGDNPGLAAYFPREAIEVDEHAFRGMKIVDQRPDFYHLSGSEMRIAGGQFWEAFEGFRKICREHGYETTADYDRVYSVHYRSATWLQQLAQLLQEAEDGRLEAVKKWVEMSDQTA